MRPRSIITIDGGVRNPSKVHTVQGRGSGLWMTHDELGVFSGQAADGPSSPWCSPEWWVVPSAILPWIRIMGVECSF